MKKQNIANAWLRSTIFLVAIMSIFMFSGCNSQNFLSNESKESEIKSFSDVSEMKTYIEDGFWICQENYDGSNVYYKIRFFYDDMCFNYELVRTSEKTLEEMFVNLIESVQAETNKSFDSCANFLNNCPNIEGFTKQTYAVQYDFENGEVKNQKMKTVGTFLNDNTMKYHGDIYKKESDISDLQTAYGQAYMTIWQKKYGDIPTNNDVQYDKYSYLGQNFIIIGSAELDDYYNYFYSDLAPVYFCMQITPEGGGYTDRWYIYAQRDTFKKLFDELKESEKSNIALICQMYSPDTGSNNMATLVDYYFI